MRFRTDSRYIAEAKALGRPYAVFYGTREQWKATPPAEPGDAWRTRWYGSDAVAGYDIGCPKCRQVHGWTTAGNCASRRKLPDGGTTCDHMGVGSCWTWTGSAEEGTLSASPSLHATGACGWHGFLTNGELRGV